MFVVDDILLSPFRSILWVFREIYETAQKEIVHEAESITAELSHLYMMLETGKISEEEFTKREKELLARLDTVEKRARGLRGSDEEEDREHVDVDRDDGEEAEQEPRED